MTRQIFYRIVLITGLLFFSQVPITIADGSKEKLLRITSLSDTTDLNASSELIHDKAELKLISSQFLFTEGPAVDKAGNVFFTDQPNNRIWKYATDGSLSVFMENAGRANGTFFDKKGNLLACADEQNQIWKISPSGKVQVLVNDFMGRRLNGPNDLWADPKGGIYFTDPYYKRAYWQRQEQELTSENVYYLPQGKTQPQMVAGNMEKPNGIVGTPDGKILYVADIRGKKTYKFAIQKDGTLGKPELFAEMGSDGMTIDRQGNLYLTGDGVTVFSPSGQKIAHIPVPEKWTANVCFSGRNRDVLFITASKSIYILQMKVKGVK